MSMSQFPSPDEEYDNIWAQVRWYHLPLIVAVMFIVIPAFELCWAIVSVKDKICRQPKPSR